MGKTRIDSNGIAERVRKFEELCDEQPLNVKAANELANELDAEFSEARTRIFSLMHVATRRHEELTKPKPSAKNESPPPTEKPRKFSAPTTPQVGPNYETPTTPEKLKTLLKRTFGVGNKSLEFSDSLLAQAMARTHLETRCDWAVYLTLLAKPASLMRETELEIETGYNIGSVAGCLNRLQEKGLARRVENDLWILC